MAVSGGSGYTEGAASTVNVEDTEKYSSEKVDTELVRKEETKNPASKLAENCVQDSCPNLSVTSVKTQMPLRTGYHRILE